MMLAALLLASPVTCTNADGTTVQMDDPGSGIPFVDAIPLVGGNGQNCVPTPTGAAKAVGDVAGGVVGDTISSLISWIQSGMADLATAVASFWTSVPTVSVGDASGTPSDTVGFMRDSLAFYTAIIAVASLVIGGIYLAWKGKTTLPALALFLVRVIAAGGLTIAVSALLISAADGFSQWVIPAANNGTDLGANLTTLFANPFTGPVGFLCLVIMALSSVFLVAMMWIRSAILVILVGTIGLAAVCWTPTWFMKQAKLIVSVILVQPLCALVFAVGFRLMGANMAAGGVTEVIAGTVTILTACWSWKFLVKMIGPYDDPTPQTGMGGVVARAAMFIALVAR